MMAVRSFIKGKMMNICLAQIALIQALSVCVSALKPGWVIRVTFSPGHPGLTRIGSREKRNCSFDDVELINAIA